MVYDRHEYADENRRVMEAVAARIMALAEGYGDDGKVVALKNPSELCDMTTDASLATLEELILACGKDFGSLERYPSGVWRASRPNFGVGAYGATPREAVARLWHEIGPEHALQSVLRSLDG